MTIRRTIGGQILSNCWIMGLLFLIRHWGRVQRLLSRENLVRRNTRDARFHCMLVLRSDTVFHFHAVDKNGWLYPYLFWGEWEVFRIRFLRSSDEARYFTLLNKRLAHRRRRRNPARR